MNLCKRHSEIRPAQESSFAVWAGSMISDGQHCPPWCQRASQWFDSLNQARCDSRSFLAKKEDHLLVMSR